MKCEAARPSSRVRRTLGSSLSRASPLAGGAAVVIFVVNSYHGPAWKEGTAMREQSDWAAHRDFMNALPEGFVLLGGPVDGHRLRAMLVVRATNLAEVHRILDPDPWVHSGTLVEIIEPWEILVSDSAIDGALRAPP